MPGQLRPIEKLAKVAYRILKVDQDKQQKNTHQPDERRLREWSVSYRRTNVR